MAPDELPPPFTYERAGPNRRDICPRCLRSIELECYYSRLPDGGNRGAWGTVAYRCPQCDYLAIPRRYVEDFGAAQREVVACVGHSTHGKTVYLASLFWALTRGGLASRLPRAFLTTLNETALKTVRQQATELHERTLPQSTHTSFPDPGLLHFAHVPKFGSRVLMLYDVNGETFEQDRILSFAQFVFAARSLIWMLGIQTARQQVEEHAIADLLTDKLRNFVAVVNDARPLENSQSSDGTAGVPGLIGSPATFSTKEKQRLVVTVTQSDALEANLSTRAGLWEYVSQGTIDAYREFGDNPDAYLARMRQVSNDIREVLIEQFGLETFVRQAEEEFREVVFCCVSALGMSPDASNRLPGTVNPLRVLDPLIWVLEGSPIAGASNGSNGSNGSAGRGAPSSAPGGGRALGSRPSNGNNGPVDWLRRFVGR